MIDKIVNYMVAAGAVAPEDAEVQAYAIESLFEMVLTHGLILVLAAVFHVLPQTAVFYVLFLPLRSYAGGYHAATPVRCLVLSVAVWAAIMAFGRLLPLWAPLPVLLVSVGLILWLAPIEHHNHPLSVREFARAKRFARILVALDAVCVLLLLFFAPRLALTGALALLSTALSLVAARKGK